MGVAALVAPQAGSCGERRERLCVLKEGLCEAGSWLAAEGRVTVRNWVATAARYLWLDVGGRRRQSSLDEMQTELVCDSGARRQASFTWEATGLRRAGEPPLQSGVKEPGWLRITHTPQCSCRRWRYAPSVAHHTKWY